MSNYKITRYEEETKWEAEEKIIKVVVQDNFLERMSPLLKDKFMEVKRKIDL